jgi:hypothetical protein
MFLPVSGAGWRRPLPQRVWPLNRDLGLRHAMGGRVDGATRHWATAGSTGQGRMRAAAPLLAGAALVGALLAAVGGGAWALGTVTFALSPLWFLGVYLALVVLLPGWLWLRRRLGSGALVLLAGLAAVVDAVRLGAGVGWFGWVNLLVVWGLAHQAGLHHEELVRAPRRVGYGLVAAGLGALCGLLALGYPGSLVGVPGERWSNMSPPTFAIVALTAVQAGLIRLGHESANRLLASPTAGLVLAVTNRYGLPVCLFHLTGYLLAQAVGWPLAALALVGLLAGGGAAPATRTGVAPARFNGRHGGEARDAGVPAGDAARRAARHPALRGP